MPASSKSAPRAMLVGLSGDFRGKTLAPEAPQVVLGSDPACDVCLPAAGAAGIAPRHAVLRDHGGRFELESLGGAAIFVNELPAQAAILDDNDLIRLGEGGPVFRFRACRDRRVTKSFKEIVDDSRAVASHAPGRRRTTQIASFARQVVREALAHGTRRFRLLVTALVLLVLVLATALVVVLSRTRTAVPESVRQELRTERNEREALQAALAALEKANDARGREESELMAALRTRAESAERRLEALDRDVVGIRRDTEAAKRIAETSGRGIAFLLVVVSFFHEGKKDFVRLADAAPGGGSSVRIGGSGEKMLVYVSGSGFVVSADGLLASNRHVVDPWWNDDDFGDGVLAAGCRPVREAFLAFFPGLEEPIPLVPVARASNADAALVRLVGGKPAGLPVVPLADRDHTPAIGEKTVLLGYPLGLEGLLTKLDSGESSRLLAGKPENLEQSLRLIAGFGGIRPTMTQGVLSTVTRESLVYDADTISGGSGGPLFSGSGWVIGVNMAVTRFKGANHGVPIAAVHRMLEAGAPADAVPDGPELPLADAIVGGRR